MLFCRNGCFAFCPCGGLYLGTVIFSAGFPDTKPSLFFSGLELKLPKQSLFVRNCLAILQAPKFGRDLLGSSRVTIVNGFVSH